MRAEGKKRERGKIWGPVVDDDKIMPVLWRKKRKNLSWLNKKKQLVNVHELFHLKFSKCLEEKISCIQEGDLGDRKV